MNKKTSWIVSETAGCTGVSRKFSDIMDAGAAYRQALAVLDMTEGSGGRVVRFDDHFFEYMLKCCTGAINPRCFIRKGF